MHMRPKAYLQVFSRLQRLHLWQSRRSNSTNQEASPLLTFIAVVLALLLAMLEVDQHGAPLQSLGLLGDTQPNFSHFMGP